MKHLFGWNYSLVVATGLVAASAIGLLAGCENEPSGSEDMGVATIAIMGESSDNADEADLGRLRGMGVGLVDGLPGIVLKCDPEPENSIASVCGVDQLSKETYAWSNCQMSMGKMGRGKGGPVSSGNAEVRHEVLSAPEGCDATTALDWQDTTDLNVTRVMPNGRQMTLSGSIVATSNRSIDATSFVKQVEVAVHRQMSDSSGSVLKDVDVTGTATVAFSVDEAGPMRVIDGTLAAVTAENDHHDIVLTGVTRRDANTCKWPLAGSLTRTEQDGTVHELAFSATCGQATLDGSTVDLNAPRGKGKHGKHGGGNCSM